MANHFENKTWVWIQGLVLSPALNEKLGEVVGFDSKKKRYMVFIPDLDENGFNSEFVSKVILANKESELLSNSRQDDKALSKLFYQEKGKSSNIKLIKPDNLKAYKMT